MVPEPMRFPDPLTLERAQAALEQLGEGHV
jgi:hypothetical protein